MDETIGKTVVSAMIQREKEWSPSEAKLLPDMSGAFLAGRRLGTSSSQDAGLVLVPPSPPPELWVKERGQAIAQT